MREGQRPHGGNGMASLAATAVVLGCTAFLHYHRIPEPPAPSDFPAPAAGQRAFLAVIVAQPADCEDGTAHLQVLNAAELRARLRVAALVIGRSDDVKAAARALSKRFGPLPVQRGTRRTLAALDALRLPSTPYLLLLDRAGTVRFSAPAPRDPAGAKHLHQTLTQLTSGEVANAIP